jgi:hypothetical protein
MKRVGVRRSGLSSESPPRLPELDGCPAKLGGSPMKCTLCGASGHRASAHSGGKAVVDRAEPSTDTNVKPSGEAIGQNRGTQFGTNKSPLTTGNPNYKSPGSEGGMS